MGFSQPDSIENTYQNIREIFENNKSTKLCQYRSGILIQLQIKHDNGPSLKYVTYRDSTETCLTNDVIIKLFFGNIAVTIQILNDTA